MTTRRHHLSLCLIGSMLCVAAPADIRAAMAPSYERVREFGIVMSAADEAAARLAPHGLVEGIERVGDGAFRFRSGRCFVPATLEPLPADPSPPQPGTPTAYRIALGEVHCD